MSIDSNTSEVEPYGALAEIYDQWMANTPYESWINFIEAAVPRPQTGSPQRALDLCCGTAQIAKRLARLGWQVTAVDRSESMLRKAQDATRTLEVRCLAADISELSMIGQTHIFDLVTCVYDSANYFDPGARIDSFFLAAANALKAGGVLVFDVNSKAKLENIFANTHYGDDLGNFAYVWRNRLYSGESRVDFDITLFKKTGNAWERFTELHSQWWHEPEALISSAAKHGLELVSCSDNYTPEPVTPLSMRETWVFSRK